MIVYHGTSKSAANNIKRRGIRMDASTLGYFGEGFYTTENKSLAKSNYADFAEDDEPGVILAFEVSPRARLLDLRKERDWIVWRDGKFGDMIHRPGFAALAVKTGIDGLYDESFEGWVFYNPKVLKLIKNNPQRRKRRNPTQTLLIKNKHRPTHNSLGQPIHPTESGIRAFWKWFGNSKAVDEEGRPLVVYHGTPDGRFIKSTGIFMSLKDRYGARKGVGVFWFAKDYRAACTYAIPERAFDYQGCEPLTLPTYIRLKHPLILDANDAKWRHVQHHGKTTYIIDQAKEQGNDGVIIRNVKDDYNNNARTITTDTFAVFSSTQIKSAKDNRGTFDLKDPVMTNPAKPLPPEQTVDRMIDLHGSLGNAKWFAYESLMDARRDKRKTSERYWIKVVNIFTRRIKRGDR